MDKKNTLIGLFCIGLGIVFMIRSANDQQTRAMEQRLAAQQAAEQQQAQTLAGGQSDPLGAAIGASPSSASSSSSPSSSLADSPAGSGAASSSAPRAVAPAGDSGLFDRAVGTAAAAVLGADAEMSSTAKAETFVLENDYVRVTFTSRGGAIQSVDFVERSAGGGLRYPATIGSDAPYRFNDGALTPALTLGLATDASTAPTDYAPRYEVLSHKDTIIQFRYTDPNGGVIIRGYEIEARGVNDQPYLIKHATKLENTRSHPLSLPALYLNVGTVPPTEGDHMAQYLNFGYYDAADSDADFLQMYTMRGFFGLFGAGELRQQTAEVKSVSYKDGKPAVEWGSVKNQFFATVLTPDGIRGSGIFAAPVTMTFDNGGSPVEARGVTGALRFDLGEVSPGDSRTIVADFYCGPKEYLRLTKLGEHQDEVMQFGYMGSISKMLLWALVGIHNVVVSISPEWAWGWAILILTVIIKAILWPLTQVQVRSSKRMAKIQKPMAELREKFKDNPQKMNQEMMKLWKEHKVNPLAGCLPILVQFPIFIGLFFMLRTASELRFAPFLWVKDLSAPENLFNWGIDIPLLGQYLNILPLLMGITMFFQMRMTPTPTTDNFQRRIFQFMPFIFLLFCYRFPSGLVIYWTGQNLISILQQWLTNRRKDDEPAPQAPAAALPGKRGKAKRAKA